MMNEQFHNVSMFIKEPDWSEKCHGTVSWEEVVRVLGLNLLPLNSNSHLYNKDGSPVPWEEGRGAGRRQKQ